MSFEMLVRKNLKEDRPTLYRELRQSGDLDRFVAERGQDGEDQFLDLFDRLIKQDPPPQETFARLQHLNMLRSQAMEIVLADLLLVSEDSLEYQESLKPADEPV